MTTIHSFLFLPLLQPHPGYTTQRDFYGMYDPDNIPDLRPAGLDNKPDFYELIRKYRRLDELPDNFLRRLMELAGLSPEHTHFARSFVPQLHGDAEDPNRFVFAEGGYDTQEPHAFEGQWDWNDPNHPSHTGIYRPKGQQQQEVPESVCRATMIRSLNHKRIRRTAGQDELYDLQSDPRELKNLIDDPGMRETRSDLEASMLDWFMKTSDTVPVRGDPRGF